MADSTRSVNTNFKIGDADAAKQDLDKIRAAAEAFGEAGKAAAQKITDGFENVERNADRVTNKISEGRLVTVKDAGQINQSFVTLDETIKKTFGDIANAPPEIQTAFATAQSSVNATTDKVRELSVFTKFLRQDINEAGGQWLGFENAIARVAGENGQYVASFFLVTKAWEAGWAVGEKLNKLFGTDMKEWEFSAEVLGNKLGEQVRALSDLIVADAKLIGDFLHGNWSELEVDAGHVRDAVKQFSDRMVEGATLSAVEYRKLHPTIKDVEEATKKANEAAQQAAEKAQQWKEKEEELARQIVEATTALKDQTEALHRSQQSAEDATLGLSNATGQQGYYKRGLDSSTAALEAQKAKVAELTREFGASDPQVTDAKNKQAELEREVSRSKTSYDDATQTVNRYETQLRSANAEIEKEKTAIKESSDKILEKKTNLELLTLGIDKEKDSQDKATASVMKAAEAHTKVSTAIKETSNELAGATTKANDMTAAVLKLVAALDQLKAASEAAAGSGASGGGASGGWGGGDSGGGPDFQPGNESGM